MNNRSPLQLCFPSLFLRTRKIGVLCRHTTRNENNPLMAASKQSLLLRLAGSKAGFWKLFQEQKNNIFDVKAVWYPLGCTKPRTRGAIRGHPGLLTTPVNTAWPKTHLVRWCQTSICSARLCRVTSVCANPESVLGESGPALEKDTRADGAGSCQTVAIRIVQVPDQL